MMKENKSPVVNGIPPKLLKEIIEKISIRLANFLSHKKGIILSEWKEANGRSLFKKIMDQ